MRGKNEQGWISVDDRLPEIDRDFGTGRNSICVLISDGKNCWVGYLRAHRHGEHPPQWQIKGRDEIARGPITHWMPLPSLPEKPGKPVEIRRGKVFLAQGSDKNWHLSRDMDDPRYRGVSYVIAFFRKGREGYDMDTVGDRFFMDEDAFEVGKLAMEYLQKLFEEERE